KGMSGFTSYFHQFELPPGQYLTEVYAHLPSITGNFYFGEDEDNPTKKWQEWFLEDRKNEELPPWLQEIKDYDVPGELEELVSYINRIAPLTKEAARMPELDDYTGWCAFEKRRPKCPLGIPRSELLS